MEGHLTELEIQTKHQWLQRTKEAPNPSIILDETERHKIKNIISIYQKKVKASRWILDT